MAASIEIDSIRKSFGDFVAVDEISFAVQPGSIFGLLGQNGAGKTTSIRMLMDIIAPDQGQIRFFGRQRQREDLDRVGYLPEERGLYRKMTVREQLVYLGELHGLTVRDARQRTENWVERLGLGEWLGKKVEELSKGMQQKIQLAGTLLHEPEVVILDEPFSGLDPINQALFKETLAGFKSEGRTLLFSTHVLEQAEKLCDEICLISQGRVILDGNLEAIKAERGGNAYRLVADGDLEKVRSLPGVVSLVSLPRGNKLILEPGITGASLLRDLVTFLEIHEFRSEEPDLEEIFIQAVQDAA